MANYKADHTALAAEDTTISRMSLKSYTGRRHATTLARTHIQGCTLGQWTNAFPPWTKKAGAQGNDEL